MGIELVLLAALVAVMIALAVSSRRRRRLDQDLADIADALGTTHDAPGILSALQQLRDRADRLAGDVQADAMDFRALAEVLPLGALRITPGDRVDLATPSALSLLERPATGVVGRSVMETFADVRADELIRTAARSGDGGAPPSPIEVRLRGPASRLLALRARRSDTGSVWVLIEDVTELRNLRRIRAEFIDNVSHELRTPVTTVSLLAETLAREAEAAEVPPKMKDRIAKIEVEMGHLVQMVNELLDLSRIESGSSLAMTEDVDLGRLAATSTERLRLFAERQGVILRVDVEPGLPRVRADEDRIGQAFVNLVHNAVKFSPDGGEVVVAVRHVDDVLAVSIEDHGVGIPRGDRARIFERFYKVDRSRARGTGGGTGLGLAIVRHVVEQHGGRIWLQSDEGKGSTFTFTIPLEPVGAPASLVGTTR